MKPSQAALHLPDSGALIGGIVMVALIQVVFVQALGIQFHRGFVG